MAFVARPAVSASAVTARVRITRHVVGVIRAVACNGAHLETVRVKFVSGGTGRAVLGGIVLVRAVGTRRAAPFGTALTEAASLGVARHGVGVTTAVGLRGALQVASERWLQAGLSVVRVAQKAIRVRIVRGRADLTRQTVPRVAARAHALGAIWHDAHSVTGTIRGGSAILDAVASRLLNGVAALALVALGSCVRRRAGGAVGLGEVVDAVASAACQCVLPFHTAGARRTAAV